MWVVQPLPISSFFKRLESYTEVRPTAAMADVIVKIVIEVLSILADMLEHRLSAYLERSGGARRRE